MHAPLRVYLPVFLLLAALNTNTAAAPPVSPTVKSATASISNIEYKLKDLAPNDGITPELRLDLSKTYTDSRSHISSYEKFPEIEDRAFSQHSAGLDGAESTISLNRGTAQFYRSGGTLGGGSSAAFLGVPGDTFSSTSFYTAFSLAPRTSVTFTGHISLSIDVDGGVFGHPLSGDYAAATTSIRLGRNYPGYTDSFEHLGSKLGTWKDSWTLEQDFSLTFSNTGSVWLSDIGFMAYQGVNLKQYQMWPAPVPEPHTYAMLGLGICLLGTVIRRQRRGKLHGKSGTQAR